MPPPIENRPSQESAVEQPAGKDNSEETKLIEKNGDANKEIYYQEMIKNLSLTGKTLRSDQKQPNLLEKPSWFDEELYKNAQSIYGRHFMAMNFAHLSGLLLLVRVDSIYSTLSATGESDSVSKLFKRYYNTVKHVKTWYEGDIFKEHSEAYQSLLIVRGMHNKVSKKFNDEPNGEQSNQSPGSRPSNGSVHISEYDIMLTQFAFIGFIVINGDKMGFLDDFSKHDLNSLLHFWRLIGYYLGASDKYNLCSYEMSEVILLCGAIMNLEYKESLVKNNLTKPQGIMSVNIVRAIKFIPMLTVFGILTYLHEIVGHETSELSDRETCYSRLSYSLIKLVMTRLLAYRPFRSFNNGLTRLSLYLIGKIEGRFSNYLDSKYGQELRI